MIELLFRKKFFYPNEYNKTIFDIDFKELLSRGITHILIDLDNTLIPYDEQQPNDDIVTLFHQLFELFEGVLIISNNKEYRVKDFCKNLNCDYIYSAKKPLKFGFKKALKKFNHPSVSSVVLIGDQLMTDVYGGNRMGFYTIVVDAIKRKSEKWYTKLNRRVEKRMMTRIKETSPEFYEKLKLGEKR